MPRRWFPRFEADADCAQIVLQKDLGETVVRDERATRMVVAFAVIDLELPSAP